MELQRKPLEMLRGLGRPAETLLHEGLEGVHRFRLAVHETHPTRPGWKRAEPAHDLTAIGMRRHRINLRDSRVHRDRLSVDPDVGRAVHELTPARTGGLVPDKQHSVAWIRQCR